tara:strand:+ start:470 stop:670 length:201 start_codon:yes stop_codon:yes gene_type:complete
MRFSLIFQKKCKNLDGAKRTPTAGTLHDMQISNLSITIVCNFLAKLVAGLVAALKIPIKTPTFSFD